MPSDSAGGVAASSELRVLDPATGEVIATLPRATTADIDAAVGRADRAQPAWAATTPSERASVLYRLADLIARDSESLAHLETRENGMPITETRGHVKGAEIITRYFAGFVDKFGGRTIPGDAGGLLLTMREPIGVAALITPWNAPLTLAALKAAPALAVGNAVVLKPSELTPLTTLRFRELLLEAGLPEDCATVLVGDGTVGAQLSEHPLVGKISFTGSTRTGRSIARAAAGTFKRLTLELGGKSAAVVFADADIDEVVAEAPKAVFGMMGQDCCARSRLLVHESVRDAVVEGFAAFADGMEIGDPTHERTEIGPLITAQQRDRVHGMVASAISSGARAVTGAMTPQGLDPVAGFYTPTVLDNVTSDMPVVRDEIFGPVVAVQTFRTDEEAVRLANDSTYGLAASVWTQNPTRAVAVSRALRVGAVSLNGNTSVHPTAPMGGYKSSGVGREYSWEALEANTEVKTLYMPG